MNQREAMVTIIERVKEEPWAYDAPFKQALKVLERRAEILRIRLERLHAQPPEDIAAEPLIYPVETIRQAYFECICVGCGKDKPGQCWFCGKCFNLLEAPLRKVLQGFRREHWPQGFSRAVRFFNQRRAEVFNPPL